MSLRLAYLGLALLATALSATIVLELDADQTPDDQTGVVAIRHPPLVHARSVAMDPVDHTAGWADTSLARPLFSRDRRPTPALAAGEVVTSIPRLTGVMVTPLGRSAIFAGPEGGKPVVVSAGGALGRYVVQAIEPGRVTVAGPEGVLQLQPSFDAAARRAAIAEAPQAQPGQPGLPGLPLQPGQQPAFNLRPGSQFQRNLSLIQGVRQPNQRNETNQ